MGRVMTAGAEAVGGAQRWLRLTGRIVLVALAWAVPVAAMLYSLQIFDRLVAAQQDSITAGFAALFALWLLAALVSLMLLHWSGVQTGRAETLLGSVLPRFGMVAALLMPVAMHLFLRHELMFGNYAPPQREGLLQGSLALSFVIWTGSALAASRRAPGAPSR